MLLFKVHGLIHFDERHLIRQPWRAIVIFILLSPLCTLSQPVTVRRLSSAPFPLLVYGAERSEMTMVMASGFCGSLGSLACNLFTSLALLPWAPIFDINLHQLYSIDKNQVMLIQGCVWKQHADREAVDPVDDNQGYGILKVMGSRPG